MNLAFLYPGNGSPYDAVDHWVKALGRFTRQHEVLLCRDVQECLLGKADAVVAITEGRSYPRPPMDRDLAELTWRGIPFGVLHNNDSGIPTPGHYPSFAWTQRGRDRLGERYEAMLLRQPVFSPIAAKHPGGLCVATFGHVEPKKCTFQMAKWAKQNDVPFRAYAPETLAAQYEDYIKWLRGSGCQVILHPWVERIEQLAPFFWEASHFLFVLPESKAGSGGSPTSPRFAGLFNRPVLVVDDEMTFTADRYYVYTALDHIRKETLCLMKPPSYDWSPEMYVSTLFDAVIRWWRG